VTFADANRTKQNQKAPANIHCECADRFEMLALLVAARRPVVETAFK
jgi:hypothetical protein